MSSRAHTSLQIGDANTSCLEQIGFAFLSFTGRPSSISKRQVVVAGAASMLPGSQALSACKSEVLVDMFTGAKAVNFKVVEKENRKIDGRDCIQFTFGVMKSGQACLKFTHFSKEKRFFIQLLKPNQDKSIILSVCEEVDTCELVRVLLAKYSSKDELIQAVLNLRDRVLATEQQLPPNKSEDETQDEMIQPNPELIPSNGGLSVSSAATKQDNRTNSRIQGDTVAVENKNIKPVWHTNQPKNEKQVQRKQPISDLIPSSGDLKEYLTVTNTEQDNPTDIRSLSGSENKTAVERFSGVPKGLGSRLMSKFRKCLGRCC